MTNRCERSIMLAMGSSFGLMAMGRKNVANFIGLWVPSILLIGLYNKLVKQLGSHYSLPARSSRTRPHRVRLGGALAPRRTPRPHLS